MNCKRFLWSLNLFIYVIYVIYVISTMLWFGLFNTDCFEFSLQQPEIFWFDPNHHHVCYLVESFEREDASTSIYGFPRLPCWLPRCTYIYIIWLPIYWTLRYDLRLSFSLNTHAAHVCLVFFLLYFCWFNWSFVWNENVYVGITDAENVTFHSICLVYACIFVYIYIKNL